MIVITTLLQCDTCAHHASDVSSSPDAAGVVTDPSWWVWVLLKTLQALPLGLPWQASCRAV